MLFIPRFEEDAMNLTTVRIEKPDDMNFILGHSHFIKTVEDVYEAMTTSTPTIKFGLAFCESSGERLVRVEGNDEALAESAAKAAYEIGAGHCFLIFLREAYPINVLTAIKGVSEVCSIFCATANPVEVLVAETDRGRGIVGVVDGSKPKGIEDEGQREERRAFLRRIGYKK